MIPDLPDELFALVVLSRGVRLTMYQCSCLIRTLQNVSPVQNKFDTHQCDGDICLIAATTLLKSMFLQNVLHPLVSLSLHILTPPVSVNVIEYLELVLDIRIEYIKVLERPAQNLSHSLTILFQVVAIRVPASAMKDFGVGRALQR